jgi:hypothetical protein
MDLQTFKSDTAGDISRFKAQFVAKVCSQRAGLDYTEMFSLVIRMASLRLFLAIAAARDLGLCQLDIDTAFLYAPIKEGVYIRQPLGFTDGTSKMCHLKRCLYGLKQSPREFNMMLRAWLVDHGWQQSVSDLCIYTFRTGHVFAMIALYVDDIPAACNDATWLAHGRHGCESDRSGHLDRRYGVQRDHIAMNGNVDAFDVDWGAAQCAFD